TVAVDVVAFYKGNNGNGVGNANCDFGYSAIVAEPCQGGPIEEPICVLTAGEFTFGFMGAIANADNTTTVSFSIENNLNEPIDIVFIETPEGTEPTTT